MPRINLEERLFSDARFIDFMFSVGDKEKAVGAFALACVAGARWYLKDPDRMIPVAEWKKQKLNDGLIEFGLATQHGEKIRLAGADDQFSWLIQKAKAGKAGADSRWHPPSPVIHPPASECRTMASSSSSSSLSSNSFLTNESPIPRARKIALSAVGDWENLTPEKIALWGKSFPGVEVKAEVAKAAAWAIANPKNKKSNWERFLVNWLTRSQDHARPGNVTHLSDYEKTLAYAKQKDREAGRIA